MKYFDGNSCGSEYLDGIDGLTFQGVEASATGCGFYMQRREQITWKNSAAAGVGWEIAVARKLLEFGLVQITAGETLKLYVGFSIFDSFQATNHSQHS